MSTGGASEAAIGDTLEVTMADWAQRCKSQGGLVVMPHAPSPQCERAADIVLGLVDAIEMMSFNPRRGQISPYSLNDWYRFLNLGYHIPVVGGSDKMTAASQLGGMRTYAYLGENEFTYENWMTSVRNGNTFVTVGPLLDFSVEGHAAGSRVELPRTGGTVNVSWKVESVCVPIFGVEVVIGGEMWDETTFDGAFEAAGSIEVPVGKSTWVGLRVRGSNKENRSEIAAHSSVVQVVVEGSAIFNQPDAVSVLDQIEGSLAYLDTLAPRSTIEAYREMRTTIEAAHRRVHALMHNNGIFHSHSVGHNHNDHSD